MKVVAFVSLPSSTVSASDMVVCLAARTLAVASLGLEGRKA